MIEAKNLVKTFTRQLDKKKKEDFNAVDDLSLTVQTGEVVGILGPNGAGKTTLLRMLATLMSPTSGEVIVTEDGEKLTSPVDIRRHIGYLSANTKLYERFTPREMMTLFGETNGMSSDAIESRIEEIISLLDMSEFADNRVAKLSTGQLQRSQIARCLIHDPECYIFDEPTLGLDVISSEAILAFMKNEKNKGKTILYSTHYMEEAQYLCDRVVLLYQGKILDEGSPAELMEKTGAETMREAFFTLIGEKTSLDASEYGGVFDDISGKNDGGEVTDTVVSESQKGGDSI